MNLTTPTELTPSHCNQPEPRLKAVRPAISLHHDDHGARLHVALPGVSRDRLKLTFREDSLSLEATREELEPPLRYELSLRLHQKLDGNAIQANLSEGVLTAVIPLKEESKPKLIPIE